ncbi:alpha/beta fold hydrolase [Massilia niastensis]|uniref:alpha/beta fold hydrolase n=1 Tax=Massilia niastensis TaxID=544911 RepID=UPI00036934F5|nr:alpha/beta hydrolase [Massilia niastensis]
MSQQFPARRAFLLSASAGLAGLALPSLHAAPAAGDAKGALALQRLSTDHLDIAYYAAGPEDGRPVVLAHDFGYDIHSYTRVAPILAAAGMRVLVPHLRGHGGTRFKDPGAPRSAQQAALGKDLIDFIDALHFPEAVFAGFGWGAHAAYAASVVRPTRCIGLVLAGLDRIDEATPWHRHVFGTEAGRLDLDKNRRAIARSLWKKHSPRAPFDEALFRRATASFDNPDYVGILVHAWRRRHGGAEADPHYEALEKKFAQQPTTGVQAITLAGAASGVAASSAGIAFTGAHSHRQLEGVGHHLPFEAPQAFADAALELVRKGKWRT